MRLQSTAMRFARVTGRGMIVKDGSDLRYKTEWNRGFTASEQAVHAFRGLF